MSDNSDIYEAIRRGNSAYVLQEIKRDPSLLYARRTDEQSVLITAVDSGNQDMIQAIARALCRELMAGRIPRERLYEAIHDLGEANFVEAEPEVAKFVGDPDPELRYIAVNVISLHWGVAKLGRQIRADTPT